MSISPVNVPRVSQNLRTQTLLEQLRANTLRLFNDQQRISTGRALLAPSDDPVAAGKIIRMRDLLGRQGQIIANLQHSDRWFSAAEAAVSGMTDLLTDAKTIALEQVNSFQSTEQRQSAAIIVDGIIDRVIAIGNQQFEDRYLFGGFKSQSAPLDTSRGRAAFVGDASERNTFFDFGQERAFNVTADRLLGLGTKIVSGTADLNPAIAASTRLSDLGGAAGAGVRTGAFRVTQIGGAGGSFQIDLAGVDTVGQLVAKFNDAAATAGTALTLSLTASGLQINGGAGIQISVAEVGGGHAAADLGVLGTSGVGAPLTGTDVNPGLTLQTTLASLNNGAGLALPSGIVITNAGQSTTVTFAGAATVQDVLNRINNAGAGVRLSINAMGNGFDLLNQISGSNLSIGENGGLDATALGIRTFHAGTRLADLHGGRGVKLESGPDIRITDAIGIAFDVDLDGAMTINDVITKINAAAGLAGSTLTASLKPNGNGLRLSQPAGAQPITVERASLSSAADDLGILKTGTPSALEGDDVNPVRAGGVLSALYRLADALRADNTAEITAAGEQIEAAIRLAADQQGQLGARSQAARDRLERTQDAILSTRELLSQLEDVDLAEAVTKFQQAQLALQANLQAGSALLNVSLLDFLS